MNVSRTALTGLPLLALLGLAACARETETPLPPPPIVAPVAITVGAPAADTSALTLSAQLSGDSEVPPVSTAASGTLEASLLPGTQVLTWTLNYGGLSGPLTGAHFHGPADRGQVGGVTVPIPEPLAGASLRGSATLSAAQMAELRAGRWYVNLHTAAHPDGEIRGQVQIRP